MEAAFPIQRDAVLSLFAVAKQLQKHQEQVDEVQIQTQSAHDGFFACDFRAVTFEIHFLDLLGVIGGQACKDQKHR